MCLDFTVFAADEFRHYKATRLDRAIGVKVSSDEDGICVTEYWWGALLGFEPLDSITKGRV